MAMDLCFGCGIATKRGARRVLETPEKSAVSSLLKNIIEISLAEAPVTGIVTDSFFSPFAETFMCRPCFGKNQRVIDIYSGMVVGVNNFISKLNRKEEVVSTEVIGRKRKRPVDDHGTSTSVKKMKPVFRSLDSAVSPAVSVSLDI